MRYLKLKLKGYKRILLNNINEISIDFNSIYQVFLGTNGSGKSSLMEEISPLPAHPSNYLPGGYKVIEIEKGGDHYVLTSNFEGKATHSFVKNNEVLLDNGTISVQREMVKQHFGITDDIRLFLLGRKPLTQLSPNKRRELFTQMSDNDLTYAFRVYKTLASKVRDHQGAVKHIKGRIASESEKLRSLEVQADVEELVHTLQDELTLLMEHRRTDLPNADAVKQTLANQLKRVEELSTALIDKPLPNSIVNENGSPEALEEALKLQSQELNTKQQMLSHFSQEHEKLSSVVGDLENEGVVDPKDLQQKLTTLNDQITKLKGRQSTFQFEGDVREMIAGAQQFKATIIDVLSALPDNSDRRYTRKALAETQTLFRHENEEAERADRRRRQIQHELDHHQHADSVTCPKCQNAFKPGMAHLDVDQLKRTTLELEKKRDEHLKRVKVASESIEKINDYMVMLDKLRAVRSNYPQANNFLDWLSDDYRFYYQPSQHIPTVDKWIKDLYAADELFRLEQEHRRLTDLIRHAEDFEKTGQGHLSQKFASLTQQIDETTSQIHTLKDDVKALDIAWDRWKRREKATEQLLETLKEVQTLKETLYLSTRNDYLTQLIRDHQMELARRSQKLNEKRALEAVIGDLKVSLGEVEVAFDNTKILTQALSPTDGLIAQQMTAFIEVVVQQMNDIIGQIYTYPMEVLPCGIESNELDYKFPVVVGDDQLCPPDVSDASEGQREVIDFAFRLVATMYLGYEGYPLFVDEVGRCQDETHLNNIMTYIKLLIESNRHTQLFMISHFASGFGAFSNADFLVLSSSNISIPQKHNEHATIG